MNSLEVGTPISLNSARGNMTTAQDGTTAAEPTRSVGRVPEDSCGVHKDGEYTSDKFEDGLCGCALEMHHGLFSRHRLSG